MLNFDTVREIGLLLANVVDGTAYGAPALKVRGNLLACVPANKSAEANSMLVRIDLGRRAQLLRQHPEIYYITDHYAPHPTILVRLSKITRTELKKLLSEAWNFAFAKPSKPARSSRPSKPAARTRSARKGSRRT
jgi:hypothetical protein